MKDLHFDNSAISTLVCDRKFHLTVVKGLRSSSSQQATFGDAYHKVMEYLDKGEDPAQAVNKVLTLIPAGEQVKLLKTITLFKTNHRIPPPIMLLDGTPLIEYKFKFLYKTIGNYRIYLEGTIDRGHIDPDKDVLVMVDYKTSAVGTDYLVAKTKKEYELAFQLSFYIYALYAGILPAEYLSYICERRYRTEIWFAFYNTSNPFQKLSRPAFTNDYLLRVVPNIIDTKINQAIAIMEKYPLDTIAPPTGFTVYKACDNCAFRPACQVAGSEREKEILSTHYQSQPYNPMTFR